VIGWIAHGVSPPPLHGAWDNPSIVALCLAQQAFYETEGPPVDCTDEDGVETQRKRWEAMLAAVTRKFHGHDPIIICNCGER
jgi:hypothetical protein